MKNGKNSGWFIFLFFLVLTGALGQVIVPIIAVIAAIVAIAVAASNAANKNSAKESYDRGFHRAASYQRATNDSSLSASDTAKINVYLRRYFHTRSTCEIGTSLSLRVHGSTYASLSSLDVYRDNTYICTLDEFRRRYPDSYREIIAKLTKVAGTQQSAEIFDAEVVDTYAQEDAPAKQAAPEEQEPLEKNAQYYIDTINSLNNNIPDEEITNGLYETTSLLKQIQTLEIKFPNSRGKLSKLYEYYLPILIRILKQFENLQDAKYDDNYEPVKEKLTKTIHLINDAMRTIITSMTDADMMNLSADLSTLEAVLQKDGLTGDQLKAQQTKDGDKA